jgi:hypothetical protein
MSTKSRWALALSALVVVALLAVLSIPKVEFIVGGALVNLGFRLQDRLHEFDFEHDESITPDDVWEELVIQNDLASDVRDLFPRTVRHPVAAVVACIDQRIDTTELVGDTRRWYFVLRTAGSVLGPPEQEMLELAVLKGVKVIVLTSHTDCAAEAAAADPKKRETFPALTELMDHRIEHVKDFLARPIIREAIAKGQLRVEFARINTATDRLVVGDIESTFP